MEEQGRQGPEITTVTKRRVNQEGWDGSTDDLVVLAEFVLDQVPGAKLRVSWDIADSESSMTTAVASDVAAIDVDAAERVYLDTRSPHSSVGKSVIVVLSKTARSYAIVEGPDAVWVSGVISELRTRLEENLPSNGVVDGGHRDLDAVAAKAVAPRTVSKRDVNQTGWAGSKYDLEQLASLLLQQVPGEHIRASWDEGQNSTKVTITKPSDAATIDLDRATHISMYIGGYRNDGSQMSVGLSRAFGASGSVEGPDPAWAAGSATLLQEELKRRDQKGKWLRNPLLASTLFFGCGFGFAEATIRWQLLSTPAGRWLHLAVWIVALSLAFLGMWVTNGVTVWPRLEHVEPGKKQRFQRFWWFLFVMILVPLVVTVVGSLIMRGGS